MAIIVIASLLCLLNITLWIIFGVKFKKIFTTDDIIENTRNELNHMIADVNRNADRNITLIEEKIKEIKAVTAEAERRIALEKKEYQKNEQVEMLSKTILEQPKQKIPITAMNGVKRYKTEQEQGELFSASDEKPAEEKRMAVAETRIDSREIPIVVPKVYLSDKPVVVPKDFNTQVKEKYDQGETIEEIAAELDRSTQEVKFALEFS